MQEHGINPAGAGQREDGQLQDLTRKQLLELEREKKQNCSCGWIF